MSAVSFLVWLLIVCLIFGVLWYVIGLLPLAQPVRNLVLGILALILVLMLIGGLFGTLPLPAFRL